MGIMRIMRLIVAGGRRFNDRSLAHKEISELTKGISVTDVAIVSGTARGADKIGEEIADFYDIEVVKFPADWDKHGKAAGHIRNAEMAEYATHLIAFWDGHSRGTSNMIECAHKKGLKVKVVRYE